MTSTASGSASPATANPEALSGALDALAVLGAANWTTLRLLIESSPFVLASLLEQKENEADDSLLSALQAHASIESSGTTSDPHLRLEAAAVALRLDALETNDFLHFHQLHLRALQILAPDLRLNDPSGSSQSANSQNTNLQSVEEGQAQFIAIFRRLAERLLNQNPSHLSQLIELVRPLPLNAGGRAYHQLYAAIALRNSDLYAEALALLDALLAQAELESEVRGRALNAAAISHFLLGHLQQALDGYYTSLALWQSLGNGMQEGLVLLNIGITHYELHTYDAAVESLLAAERCFERNNALTWIASVQNELGLVYRDQGRFAEAVDCFKRCLARRQAEGATDRIAGVVNNLGELYLLQGEWQAAAAAFREALGGMIAQLFRVDVLLNLGLVHLVQEELEAAHEWLAQALALAQEIERQDILPMLHYRYGDLLSRQGKRAEALAHFAAGIDLIEQMRVPLRTEEVKISLLGRWQQLYERVILLQLAAGNPAQAVTYVERARAHAFLDLLTPGLPTPGPTLDTPATDPSTADPSAAEQLSALTAQSPLTAAEIMAQLPEGVALVEYFATGQAGTVASLLATLPAAAQALRQHLLAPEELLAFVITRQAIHAVHLPVRLSQIEAQHFQRGDGRLRGAIATAGQPLAGSARWRDLGRALLEPLRPYLQGITHIVFVPHSLLHYLPLHALSNLDELTGIPGTTASNTPSASILLKNERAPSQHRTGARALAIGVNGPALANAEAEARWIARLLHGDSLTGAAATPAAVLAAMGAGDYAIMHFSCHGLFRRRAPMESALLLTDGELRAGDLLATVQLNADIVTLSACDTGLNRLTPGDEMLGLTRAFLGAGTRTLMVALWPVHELPTRFFMQRFYSAWEGGASKAAAMRHAKEFLVTLSREELSDLLAQEGRSGTETDDLIELFSRMLPGDHPFNHPYYWAAFVLIGEE